MDEMITVYLYGKKYTVPSSLTIMEAFEYSGYQLVRGCGCRNGFCGACATIYRIKGETTLHGCLACSTKVEDNMCVASPIRSLVTIITFAPASCASIAADAPEPPPPITRTSTS